MCVKRLGSRIHPDQARTEMFAYGTTCLAITKISATEHHEIYKLGDTSVVCTWVIIGRNDELGQTVHQLEFSFGKELRLKISDSAKSRLVSWDFVATSESPAAESRKNTSC